MKDSGKKLASLAMAGLLTLSLSATPLASAEGADGVETAPTYTEASSGSDYSSGDNDGSSYGSSDVDGNSEPGGDSEVSEDPGGSGETDSGSSDTLNNGTESGESDDGEKSGESAPSGVPNTAENEEDSDGADDGDDDAEDENDDSNDDEDESDDGEYGEEAEDLGGGEDSEPEEAEEEELAEEDGDETVYAVTILDCNLEFAAEFAVKENDLLDVIALDPLELSIPDGEELIGWIDYATGEAFDSYTPITADMTLYPVTQTIPVSAYIVEFAALAGGTAYTQELEPGAAVDWFAVNAVGNDYGIDSDHYLVGWIDSETDEWFDPFCAVVRDWKLTPVVAERSR